MSDDEKISKFFETKFCFFSNCFCYKEFVSFRNAPSRKVFLLRHIEKSLKTTATA